MKKKNILIAILFATIMLLVPLNSICGASIDGLNTKVEVDEDTNPVIPDFILEELDKLINLLLLNYGHIPEIVANCNELLELINTDFPSDAFCNMLYVFGYTILSLYLLIYQYLIQQGIDNPLAWIIAVSLLLLVYRIDGFGKRINCWGYGESTFFKYNKGLNLQTLQNSISNYDLTTITELYQANELNGCPCIQQ